MKETGCEGTLEVDYVSEILPRYKVRGNELTFALFSRINCGSPMECTSCSDVPA